MILVNTNAYDRAYEIVSLWTGEVRLPTLRNFKHDVIDQWLGAHTAGYGGLTLSEFLDKTGLADEFVKCVYVATGKTIDGVPVYKADVLTRRT